jgi:uncharacterized protein YqeY
MINELRVKLTQAMKDRNERQKNALRFIIAELERQNSDETKVIRKVIANNSETLAVMPTDDARYADLVWENEFYNSLLPTMLSVEQIEGLLVEVSDAIKLAKDIGPATGIAMKLFKTKNITNVSGQDVQTVVKKIRES